MKETGTDTSVITEQESIHQDQPSNKTVLFNFRGDGFEFFKIWIVNILLTILTLGIYSA